jgi:hypothetical protein
MNYTVSIIYIVSLANVILVAFDSEEEARSHINGLKREPSFVDSQYTIRPIPFKRKQESNATV